MSDVTRIDVNIKGSAEQTKGFFSEVAKVSTDFFRGVESGWKQGAEQLKKHHAETETLAKKVAGKNKDDIAGAFDIATAAANAFGAGIRKALPGVIIAELAAQSVKVFAEIETAQNRVIATGKATREETEKYQADWAKWGPNVNKPIVELLSDFTHLLTTNDKLKDHFELMEKFGKVTNTNFVNVTRLVNTSMVHGVKPEELHTFLNSAARAYEDLGDEGAKASVEVSENLAKNGVQGGEVQRQTLAIIGGLSKISVSAADSTNILTQFMNKLQGGGTDSGMQNFFERLKEGKITLIQFMDELIKVNNPDDPDFQNKLRNDPVTKQLAIWYKDARDQVLRLNEVAPDLTKNPILDESTAVALNRFTDALRELLAAVAAGLPAKAFFDVLAEVIKQDTADVKALMDLITRVTGGTPEHKKKATAPIKYLSPAQSGFGEALMPWSTPGHFGATPPPAAAPGTPAPFADGGTVDRETLAMTGERGAEAVMGSDGAIKRVTGNATISTLDAGDTVVPAGSSTGLPREQTRGFNPDTARYGPGPEGSYYTKATTYGGYPGDQSRGIPRIVDPDDRYGSNQAGVKEEHQGISLPGGPFGGTETGRSPVLDQLFQVQLPDGSTSLQRVTDSGPGHTGHGGTDISKGAIAREYGDPRSFGGGDIRYRQYRGGALPGNMRTGRNLVTAGGYLDTSSGEGSLAQGTPEYDIPGRYKPPPEQMAWRPTVRPKVEVVPPERHEIERAARSTTSRSRSISRREQQSSHAGKIGHM